MDEAVMDPFTSSPTAAAACPESPLPEARSTAGICRDWLARDVETALAEDLLATAPAALGGSVSDPAAEITHGAATAWPSSTSANAFHRRRRDWSSNDRTAALIAPDAHLTAELWLKEPARICGQPWFNAVLERVDPRLTVRWDAAEGEDIATPGVVATLSGPAAGLLTAERAALNLLQTLSGTATTTARWVAALAGTGTRLLDTRKTLPGLRHAQKYATRIGGATNHRFGLWDAILIKENHIAACGSITRAVQRARDVVRSTPAVRWIEVETETLAEVDEALSAGADVIMLDEFSLEALAQAVQRIRGRAISEASGNVRPETLADIAATGVDYISSGALTKHLQAIDFSLRYCD